VAALDLNRDAELFQRHNQQIGRLRTDGAAARRLTQFTGTGLRQGDNLSDAGRG
jgi:hypothetical protein